MLTRIEFENYRIFKKRQTLEIKPITILFGKNNAGKSAVLKLPSLALSIHHSKTPDTFDTKYLGVKICEDYRDLVYNKASNAVNIKYQFETAATEVLFHVDIDNLVVDKFERTENNEGPISHLDYIGPFRVQRNLVDLRLENQTPRWSGIDGVNLYQTLLRDAKTPAHLLCDKVSRWYQDNFEGWGIYVDVSSTSTGDVYNVVMRNNGITTPIWDCGTGIIQSLPIVIRACKGAEEPTLVVIEEPESHLNPAAHAGLCQLIVDSTKEDSNKSYLIETHSHTFILRLQRLLAEKKISPDEIALYYVNYNEEERSSELKRIEMMQDGSIPRWPKGMFQDVMKELVYINQARFGEIS